MTSTLKPGRVVGRCDDGTTVYVSMSGEMDLHGNTISVEHFAPPNEIAMDIDAAIALLNAEGYEDRRWSKWTDDVNGKVFVTAIAPGCIGGSYYPALMVIATAEKIQRERAGDRDSAALVEIVRECEPVIADAIATWSEKPFVVDAQQIERLNILRAKCQEALK